MSQPELSAWILVPKDAPRTKVFGLTPEERLRRALSNAGCRRVQTAREGEPPPFPLKGAVLLLRGDVVLDPRLVAGLFERRNVLLLNEVGGEPVAASVEAERAAEALALLREPKPGAAPPPGVEAASPSELAPAYLANLRKAEPPAVYVVRPGEIARIEDDLFAASYKTITDLVTLWLWPAPAKAATRWLADRRVHPNWITAASWVFALLAIPLFAQGSFGLGLLVAWAMTFLDTVDGKLARVTLTSSPFGHAFDHGLDILHPPFWYAAWAWGVSGSIDPVGWIVVGGYVAGRLLELAFMTAFGLEMFSWRPFDTLFRTIVARRNPNLILLTVGTLGGRPDLGLAMVAIWTVVCLGVQAARLAIAGAARARGEAVSPWNESPPPASPQ